MPAREQLDRTAAAGRLGVQTKTLDEYRRRTDMGFPAPDGQFGRSPWWWSTTIDRWDKGRKTLPANRAGAVSA